MVRYRVLKALPEARDWIEETWQCGPRNGCGAVWQREAFRRPSPFWGPLSHTHAPEDPFTGCPHATCAWHDPKNTSTILDRVRE